jgi:hypothetical protein
MIELYYLAKAHKRQFKELFVCGSASAFIPLLFKRGNRDWLIRIKAFIAAGSRSHRNSNLKNS